jgi:hypothetical protein
MYERKKRPVISQNAFARRMLVQLLMTLSLLVLSLLAGMAGFRFFENYSGVDCFLNTAMLLGGMGQINPLTTDSGKIFAGLYSIFSGLFMVVCGGLLLAPIFHRILHHFHAE